MRRRRRQPPGPIATPATATTVGTVALRHPIMTASGTAGHGAELAPYADLAGIGAVVVKSLRAEPWAGNSAPRVHETPGGMLNSVGLQGPGVEVWLRDELSELTALGATVVASIWGTSVEDYARAAEQLVGAPADIVAVEVNVSCPNHHDRDQMFAHTTAGTSAAVSAVTAVIDRPVWAKLSPNVTDLPSIARAAQGAGAEAVTLVNTVMGMVIDVDARRPRLDGRGGGLSGPAIHPVAVRAVWDVHAAVPDLPIVGVGGVARGIDAVELLMAGAAAVQVGTASFADPASVERIARELSDWCDDRNLTVSELVGAAHP